MKGFLAKQNFGFFVTAGLALLSIVTAIVYAVSYRGFYSGAKEVFSPIAFWFLLAWVVVGVILYVLKQGRYAHYVAAVAGLIAFLTYAYGIYYYASVMAVGIDATFNAKFFVNTILFVLIWVGSIANVFFPQEKTAETGNVAAGAAR